ncbi:MAG: hypothetical protein ACRDNS_01620, partial [Trebonia sp.]
MVVLSGGDPSSNMIMPSETALYYRVTEKNPIIGVNFALTDPSTRGQPLCPSDICYPGMSGYVGTFAAGTGLVFNFSAYFGGTYI